MGFHCSTVDLVFNLYVCAGIVGVQGFTVLKPQKIFFQFARDTDCQGCQYSRRPKPVTACVSFSCGFVGKNVQSNRVFGCIFVEGFCDPESTPAGKVPASHRPEADYVENNFFFILKKKGQPGGG